MLRSHGYATVFSDGPLSERDTCQCGHCNRHVSVKPGHGITTYLIPDEHGSHITRDGGRFREEPGAFCRVCMSPICLDCHTVGRCVPFEQKLEQWEARDRLVRAVVGA